MEMTSASFRRGSSSWRSNSCGDSVFSRSMRGELDDEEALMKWAAIERLPTYDRVKVGMWKSLNGEEVKEVDVLKLGLQERQDLLDRLVNIADEDNEKFLLKLKNRLERVGIELPTIEVRFEHLNVEAQAHVGSRALPSLVNFVVGKLEGVLNSLHLLPSRKKQLSILSDVSGIISPSRMTLLLGPPSSGKTTLLLALAGKLDPTLKFFGSVTYNGHRMNEFVPQRTAAYISQHDVHSGELTVRETLAFSARCQGVGFRHEMLAELLRREKEGNVKPDPDLDVFMKAISAEGQEANVVTDYILKILGLEICADTIVGDEMRRGISGGQRKRLTTGEMLVGPARALFMDEISTGLDSSTTFQIVNTIKQAIHILKGTALISLLQPAPETYDLFDDVILLSDGHIVYQGPRENVLEFFEQSGFKCPERKNVADFLQEVTSKKDQEQYWARKNEPYRFVTVKEFVEAFKSFHVGKDLGDRLSTPYDKTKSHPAALATRKYGARKIDLFKACFARQALLMKRNSFVYIFKLSQLFVLSIITSTLFLRTNMHRDSVADGGIYLGALFFTVMGAMFNGTAELALTLAQLPVFYKQRDFLFYPSWAFSLPSWILGIPISFVEMAVAVLLTYYPVGFDSSITRCFRYYLVLALINQMASGVFRLIAGIGRDRIVSYTFGSFALLTLFALGGVVLSRANIKKWWIWGYWMSPLMYGQSAIVVNEFLGKSWSHIPPNSTESLGVIFLKSRGFFPDPNWYWIGVWALIGFLLLFNILSTIAFSFLNPFGKPQAHISEETSNQLGGTIQSSQNDITDKDNNGNINKGKGMILPFEPHCLTFDEVSYSVDMPQEMKDLGVVDDKLVLLENVSGAFRPGVLTALMGVSGAGKTTLMDVLAGRKTSGYVEGNITVSGYPKKQETFMRIAGYCEQTDIHSPHVTVYESLLYSAWLRLPVEVDAQTRMRFVEEVMALVELSPLRHALVGLPGVNGLSIEQRKRLTIAVELVANPSIIFMDEPTSGLDARAAAIVMRTVRNTVDTGRTVVCTIHQPSIDIFDGFDELFLLKIGGQVIYSGPVGRHGCHLIKYFEAIVGVKEIKDGYNPATWMLEVTSPAQEVALGVDFATIYQGSELYRSNKAAIKELSTHTAGSKDIYFPTKYAQPFFSQLGACLWKQHWSYWRNASYNAVRLLFTVVIAVMFGAMFWQLGSKRKNSQDIFNAIGSMYSAVLFLGFQNSSSVQPVVDVERSVFYREKAAGMYSSIPYAFAQVLIELPYVFVQAIIYGLIVYSMIGFEWVTAKIFWYLFFMFFTLMYFTLYGMMVVALTPNYHIAGIVSSGLFSLWNLFSGFLIPQPRMPIWWSWYYWISPMAWSLYGLLVSQYGDLKDKLEMGLPTEEFVREYFGYKRELLGVAAIAVVVFTATFAFIFAVGMKLFNFQKR